MKRRIFRNIVKKKGPSLAELRERIKQAREQRRVALLLAGAKRKLLGH